ncbi:MAG: glycoside hydrolase domain-containing protein [Armatimonadota bacterium]
MLSALFFLSVFMAPASPPNASFDLGDTSPRGWQLVGEGAWEQQGRTGARCVSVRGRGDDTSFWRSTSFAPNPGGIYRLSFWLKGTGTGGCAVAGLDAANRDYAPPADWQNHWFVFRAPDDRSDAFLRFGQWHVNGQVWFDDVSITPVIPIHARSGPIELGIGEQVEDSIYTFSAPLTRESSNYARPLVRHTAGFNTDRWTFGPGQEVCYRHSIAGTRQLSGSVSVSVQYHVSGACRIEASTDGRAWVPVGTITGVQTRTFELPNSLLPASEVWVRLQSDGGQFQVHSYEYRAVLSRPLAPFTGRTRFAQVAKRSTDVRVELVDLGALRPGPACRVRLRVSGHMRPLTAHVLVTEPGSAKARRFSTPVRKGPQPVDVDVPYSLRRSGTGRLRIQIAAAGTPSAGKRTSVLFDAETDYRVSSLYAADYGYAVSSTAIADLWWCEAAYKVSRDRPAPTSARPAVLIEAAKGEFEPFQLVIAPKRAVQGLTVTAADFVSPQGARIPAGNVSLRLVDYVRVTTPTDSYGDVGDWPDPLPPITGPIDLKAHQNQPLWITVRVPTDARAGTYTGRIRLSAGTWSAVVPVRLRVWDFALPKSPRITSALGLDPHAIQTYHHLDTQEELAQVWDLYMRNFADHRVSPYFPMAMAPIGVQVVNDSVKLDFDAFDRAAHRYLDELGFTTFMLPIQGMPGGTFHDRHLGSFAGHQQGTPEYERLMDQYLKGLQDHLEQKGWLSKAYVYWFDEPEPKDYPFVREGMEILRRHAPKLARMLTEQPEPELEDVVDIWCPILDMFRPDACRRQKELGKKVWWYVCTGPKGPYTTLFIDHPAVNMRMWVWLAYKYGVDGLLVWTTNWWTSDTAFPPPAKQDPWADPMSYVSGYGTPPGTKAHWGNGDGRFLYPPKGHADGRKRITGPVDSFRWEMLREGLEDTDMFFLLQDAVKRAETAGVQEDLVRQAKALVHIPEAVASGLTEFTRDPQPMYRHRSAVGRVLERLLHAVSGR